MTRALVASDDFNRAELGANWAQLNEAQGSVIIAGDSVITGSAVGQEQSARWVGAGSFQSNQYASLVIGGLAFGGSNNQIGVIARASGDVEAGRDFYFHAVIDDAPTPGPKTTVLGKIVDGSIDVLDSGGVAWEDGDRVEIEVEGDALRGLRNGAVVLEATDGDLTTGLPGVLAKAASPTGDDWEAGNLESALVGKPWIE
jgi:hypothetical protein